MKRGAIFLILFVVVLSLGGFYFTGKILFDSSGGEFLASVDDGIIVLDEEFNDFGSSTNFLSLRDSELENISNMILETSYGKIKFNEEVNLSGCAVDALAYPNGTISYSGVSESNPFYRKVVDLDGNVFILNNNVTFDSSFSCLSKSSLISIHDLSFSYPTVYRNGANCTSCSLLSYVGGTLIFSANSLGNYWIEEGEAPAEEEEETSDSSSSTSGDTGAIYGEGEASFFVEEDYLWVKIVQGEDSRQAIRVTNDGDKSLVLDVDFSDSLKRFLFSVENTIILSPGESYLLPLNFFALTSQKPDAYMGELFISQGDLQVSVPILIEVFDRNPIFDVLVDVEDRIFYGSKVKADINVLNMGTLKGIDLVLFYSIRDFGGNLVSYREESLFIEDELDLNKELSFPRYRKGDFVFYVNVSYENITAYGSDYFVVEENQYFLAIVVVLVILILLLIAFIIPKSRRYIFSKFRKRKEEDLENLS